MEEILNVIMNNPVVSILIGSSVGGMFLWFGIRLAIKYASKYIFQKLLTDAHLNSWSNQLDNEMDKIQRKDPETGKLLRASMIRGLEKTQEFCKLGIEKLKEADGIN